MVLVSAITFGTLGIFAKFAYIAGLGTDQTLAFRFALAAIGMLALAMALGQNPLRLKRNELGMLLMLGAVVYTAQALTYFIALRSLTASVVVLIAYIYPSLVVLAGWLFLRRSVSMWHGLALLATFAVHRIHPARRKGDGLCSRRRSQRGDHVRRGDCVLRTGRSPA